MLTFEMKEIDGISSDDLLCEVAQYIIDKYPNISYEKLSKTLYHIDFKYYAIYGKPLTGSVYVADENGVYPMNLPELLKSEKITFCTNGYGEISMHNLKYNQIEFVDTTVKYDDALINKDPKDSRAYKSATANGFGEKIPYDAVFISDEPMTDEDIKWTKEMIEKHNWKDVQFICK